MIIGLIILTLLLTAESKTSSDYNHDNDFTRSEDYLAILKRLEYLEACESNRKEETYDHLKQQVTDLKTQLYFTKANYENLHDDILAVRSENDKLKQELVSLKQLLSQRYGERRPFERQHDNEKPLQDDNNIEYNDKAPTEHQRDVTNQLNTYSQRQGDKGLQNDKENGHETKPNRQLKQSTQYRDDKEGSQEVQHYSDIHQLATRRIQKRENEMAVAFYATLSNPIMHAGVGQNIAFDNVITNVGNAYNKHAGDFRAPVAGIYVFSATVMNGGVTSSHFCVMKNSTQVGYFYVRNNIYEAYSATMVLDLHQGEDVWVENCDEEGNVHWRYSSFSGFLLQQTSVSPEIVG